MTGFVVDFINEADNDWFNALFSMQFVNAFIFIFSMQCFFLQIVVVFCFLLFNNRVGCPSTMTS